MGCFSWYRKSGNGGSKGWREYGNRDGARGRKGRVERSNGGSECEAECEEKMNEGVSVRGSERELERARESQK